MQQLFSVLVRPAYPLVAGRQGPGGRCRKQQTAESLLARLGDDEVAQMGSHRLAVAQVVVGLQVGFPASPTLPRPHRFEPDRRNGAESIVDRGIGRVVLEGRYPP